MSFIHRGCSALLRYLIFDVADVRLEWRQPSQVDQSVVSAAIDIACGVFSPAAGDYSSKQLDVFVLHNRHLFRKPWLDQAAECSSTSRREQPETSEKRLRIGRRVRAEVESFRRAGIRERDGDRSFDDLEGSYKRRGEGRLRR